MKNLMQVNALVGNIDTFSTGGDPSVQEVNTMITFFKLLSTATAIAVVAGVFTLSTVPLADAQQRMGKGMGQGQGMGRGQGRSMERFGMLDENGDGRITPKEMNTWRDSVFATMDEDDDGHLTMTEYMAVRMGGGDGRNPARQKMMQDRKRKNFKPMDKDGSGKVSKAEWVAGGKIEFSTLDGNGDGAITPGEFRANRHMQ